MYRNKIDVTSNEGIPVDAGSLWFMVDGVLVLDDEDQHLTHDFTTEFVKAN
ncbi:hypothetical protein [Sediminibacter sp. Hel_I_10]|uniref:hypothetical protein n=1 Tax=Sediminibacter sp. Hel_I_10 TaxID=1392490 RepID=UPI0012DE6F2B|nr:hypothetical protein [Sediminibacter sp. Hel_I_10]